MTKKKRSRKMTDTPHDTLVREHFQHPENAVGLIRAGLSAELFAELEIASLRHHGLHLNTPALLKSVTDLLFTCSLRDGSSAFVYIVLEHKSHPDALVAVQVLKYMALLWDHHRRHAVGDTRLPFIIPLVFYHGRQHWEPCSLRQLFPQDSPLLQCVPEFSLQVCNLHTVNEEPLHKDVRHNGMLLLLKALLSGDKVSRLAYTVHRMSITCKDAEIADILHLFFNYLAEVEPTITLQSIDEELSRLPGGWTMGEAFQRLWEDYSYHRGVLTGEARGEARGKAEGKAEGARTMLFGMILERYGVVTPEITLTLNAIDDVQVLRTLVSLIFEASSLSGFEMLLKRHLEGTQQ